MSFEYEYVGVFVEYEVVVVFIEWMRRLLWFVVVCGYCVHLREVCDVQGVDVGFGVVDDDDVGVVELD